MTIEVTQADIDAGLRCKTLKCPVALAVARATGREFIIGIDAVSACGEGSIELPLAAKEFILKFDGCEYRSVKPFTFDLPLSDQSNP